MTGICKCDILVLCFTELIEIMLLGPNFLYFYITFPRLLQRRHQYIHDNILLIISKKYVIQRCHVCTRRSYRAKSETVNVVDEAT